MRFYETLYIVNPNFESDKLMGCQKEIEAELGKTKSKIINHRIWSKKRLAYPIDKQKYGTYILLQFEGGDLGKMVDFDTWMKLNNQVLRHMTTALNSEPEVYVEEEQKEKVKSVSEPSDDLPAGENDSESSKEEGLKEAEDEITEEIEQEDKVLEEKEEK
ncbi:MAG: 30S ribosomal protein S6 [Candidatus Marinimicrobia bacterium]|nr:30S ribosomal protein S6 [Candidatus Neomarinimicrobiota bacterium]